MGRERNRGNTPDINDNSPIERQAVPRKSYVAPVLIEYGTIAKLTQGSNTRNNDGSNTRKRMRMCL